MSDTPRTDAATEYDNCAVKMYYVDVSFAEQLERELASVTAERDALLAVVNALADKRWFLDNVGAECTFEGSPMVQIGHLEELVEMAETALRGKERA